MQVHIEIWEALAVPNSRLSTLVPIAKHPVASSKVVFSSRHLIIIPSTSADHTQAKPLDVAVLISESFLAALTRLPRRLLPTMKELLDSDRVNYLIWRFVSPRLSPALISHFQPSFSVSHPTHPKTPSHIHSCVRIEDACTL